MVAGLVACSKAYALPVLMNSRLLSRACCSCSGSDDSGADPSGFVPIEKFTVFDQHPLYALNLGFLQCTAGKHSLALT